MNIFWLDYDIRTCAAQHCDKHVVKMIVEMAQITCTALHINGIDRKYLPYRPCFAHHPSTQWAAASYENFQHTLHLALALCDEYTHRYGKNHKTRQVLVTCSLLASDVAWPSVALTTFARAIKKDLFPDLLDLDKFPCPVDAYREYYMRDKQHIAKWTSRPVPHWFQKR